MAQSASRDDGMLSLPPESASSSTLRSVPLDRVAMALQQNSAADFLQQSQSASMAAAIVQQQLAARCVFFSSFTSCSAFSYRHCALIMSLSQVTTRPAWSLRSS